MIKDERLENPLGLHLQDSILEGSIVEETGLRLSDQEGEDQENSL